MTENRNSDSRNSTLVAEAEVLPQLLIKRLAPHRLAAWCEQAQNRVFGVFGKNIGSHRKPMFCVHRTDDCLGDWSVRTKNAWSRGIAELVLPGGARGHGQGMDTSRIIVARVHLEV